MPIVRYIVVIGLVLSGLLFAADTWLPRSIPVQAAGSQAPTSIDYWRNSQKRPLRLQAAAVDLSNSPSMAPTPERLQWEKRLSQVSAQSPLDARAELQKNTVKKETVKAEAIETPVAEMTAPVRKRSITKLPAHPRTASGPRDGWYPGQPYYGRDPYRYGSRQSWASRFDFFN